MRAAPRKSTEAPRPTLTQRLIDVLGAIAVGVLAFMLLVIAALFIAFMRAGMPVPGGPPASQPTTMRMEEGFGE